VANDSGLLPKARREDLDERLRRRRLDRWYENAYKDDNLFLTMARRPGLLDATWGSSATSTAVSRASSQSWPSWFA
jgi:hypothetical protein